MSQNLPGDGSWIVNAVRPWIPARVRASLRPLLDRWEFDRTCRSIARLGPGRLPASDQITRLRDGWANEWSASVAFLSLIAAQERATLGPVLECGSGISTVLLGLMTRRRRREVWSLEHDAGWADRVEAELAHWHCRHVRLLRAPLVDRGDYAWYGTNPNDLPTTISLLVIDGPPASTKGGRRGALHEVGHRLSPGAVVMLDDANREGEVEAWKDWAYHWSLRLDSALVGRNIAIGRMP